MLNQTTEQIENFSIDHAALLQFCKSINALQEAATIVISSEGITYRDMDPSHVALMDIALPNSIFEKYAISNEKKIGLKVRELLDAVKSLDKKSSVKVEFLAESIRLTQKGMILSVKTEEPSSNDTPLPRIPYDARIELGQKQFKEIVKKAASVGDYLTIDTMDSTVIFSSKGDNGDYQETKTKEDFI